MTEFATTLSGRRIAIIDEPAQPNAPTTGSMDCIHRGDQCSTVGCTSCGGKDSSVPVFECALYEECTVDRPVGGIKYCQQCRERATDAEV